MSVVNTSSFTRTVASQYGGTALKGSPAWLPAGSSAALKAGLSRAPSFATPAFPRSPVARVNPIPLSRSFTHGNWVDRITPASLKQTAVRTVVGAGRLAVGTAKLAGKVAYGVTAGATIVALSGGMMVGGAALGAVVTSAGGLFPPTGVIGLLVGGKMGLDLSVNISNTLVDVGNAVFLK